MIRYFLGVAYEETAGQDIAEYGVMLAAVFIIIMGMIQMIESNSNSVFSQVGSAIQ